MTAAPQEPLPLVPYPAFARVRPGSLRLDGPRGVRVESALDTPREAALLRAALDESRIPQGPQDDPRLPCVRLTLGEWSARQLDAGRAADPEAYRLEITPEGVDVHARTGQGLARGIQTLRQLLLAQRPALPCCLVEDAPRFPWRGVMLDVARHFLPKSAVLRMLDLAALHRLNTVHLHLTDDQGWRLEVPGWPLLTEVGGWREGTLAGHAAEQAGHDPTPHGGHYTRGDLAEIAAYAADRHLTLVPEVDMPGHVQAALAAYPELGVTGPHKVAGGWGVSDHVLAPTERALGFARDVLDAVFDAFDGPVVHLGGDECPRTEWRSSPAVRARAGELGLDSVEEIQSWFHGHLAAHARAAGRRVAGWDEMVESGDAPPDALILAWRDWITPGVAGAALAAGHDIVRCPTGFTYLDHYQSEDPGEPLANCGHLPLEKAAAFDPLTSGIPEGTLEAPGAGRVLGVQGQLWSEYLPTARDVEYMAFPRLGALAEAGWSQAATRAAHPFAERAPAYTALLARCGVNHRPLDGPRPWQRGGTGRRARPATAGPQEEAGTQDEQRAPTPDQAGAREAAGTPVTGTPTGEAPGDAPGGAAPVRPGGGSRPQGWRPTMKDVAAAAGVSLKTVSRVVNGEQVNEEMAHRVREAVRRLGYRLNESGRVLRQGGRTDTVALVLPSLTDPYLAGIADAAERWARAARLALLLSITGDDPAAEREALAALTARGVDGLLLVPSRRSEAGGGLARELPVVTVGRPLPESPNGTVADTVFGDEAVALRAALERLPRGASVGFLGRPDDEFTGRERLRAFHEAAGAAGVTVGPVLGEAGEPEESVPGALALLGEAPVDALVIADGRLAAHALPHVAAHALPHVAAAPRAPRTLLVHDVAPTQLASFAGRLTVRSLTPPPAVLARTAARLLEARLRAPAQAPRTVYVPVPQEAS